MATITAFIYIGTATQNQKGINPTHCITLYENDHPSLSIHSIDNNKEIIRIRPNEEKLVDNIYLLIHTFVLKADLLLDKNMDGKYIHKIFNDEKNKLTREKIMESIETYHDVKVVFNILSGSTLLNQLDKMKEYPNDYEVTTPKFRKEYCYRADKIEYEEF